MLSSASGVPIMHIFSFIYRLSQAFIASTMSLPCPGAPIILSMLMLKLDESNSEDEEESSDEDSD